MEREIITEELNIIFEDIIDEGPVSLADETTAAEVEGWDSLTNIQLVVDIERHFGIRFTSEEIMSWKNVGEIIDCIIHRTENPEEAHLADSE
jgi:acyl carrier protein